MQQSLCRSTIFLFCLLTLSISAQFTVSLPYKKVTVERKEGNTVFQGAGCFGKPGSPMLPAYMITFLLPEGVSPENVSVTIEKPVETIIEGTWTIEPALPPTSRGEINWPEGLDIVDNKDMSIYGSNRFYPEAYISNVSSGKKRQYELLRVTINPYLYNPSSQKLKMISGGRLTVHLPDGAYDVRNLKMNMDQWIPKRNAEKFIRNHTINPEVMESYQDDSRSSMEMISPVLTEGAGDASGGYAIITTVDIVNGSAELQNLVDQKEEAGFSVHVITETTWGGGSTGDERANNIRQWLVDNYEDYEIEYVLLIGNPDPENGDVPMKMCYPRSKEPDKKEAPTDFYYAELDGGDWDANDNDSAGEVSDFADANGPDFDADVSTGRIPFYGTYADLDKIIAKSIAYANATSREWRKTMLLPMEPLDTITDMFELGEAINEYLKPAGWESYRIYDKENRFTGLYIDDVPELLPTIESSPCTREHTKSAWQYNPFGMVIWDTHGSETSANDVFSSADAPDLDDRFPAMTFQSSCENAWPENSGNLAYTLLLNGAVTTIGATRSSWYKTGRTTFDTRGCFPGMAYNYGKYMVEDGMAAGDALNLVRENVVWWDVILANQLVANVYGCPDLALNIDENAPIQLVTYAPATDRITLNWVDQSDDENGFHIERSTDGSNFTRIASVDPDVTNYPDTDLLPGVKYFYRVQMFNDGGVSDYSDIDSTSTFANASLGAAATASSYLWGYEPEDINDNSTSTRWVASSGTMPQWVILDLGDVRPVSGCEIVFPFNGNSGDCYDYTIETSDDNNTWTVWSDCSDNTITETVQSCYFESFARYVRITVSDAPGSYRASVNELRVFGTVLPTQPYWKQTTVLTDDQLELCWKPSANADSYTLMQSRTIGAHRFVIAGGLEANTHIADHLLGGKNYVFSIVGVNDAGHSINAPGRNETIGNADNSPPNPVKKLSISANAAFSGFTLSWTCENINNETGYEIERRVEGAADWTVIASPDYTSLPTYVDISATDDVIYEYRVFVVNDGVRSEPSNVVDTRLPPVVPTLSLNYYDPSAQTIELHFLSLCEPPINGYRLAKMVDNNLPWQIIADVNGTVNSYTDGGIVPNHVYKYQVTAYNDFGESPVSIQQIVPTVPDAPDGLQAVSPEATSVTLYWNDNSFSEDQFMIERQSGGGGFALINSVSGYFTTFTDATVVSGVTYQYRIYAENDAGNSTYSNTVTITAGNIIFPAPVNVNASASSASEINLSWTDNCSGESGFFIEQAESETGPYRLIGTSAANATSFTVTDLGPVKTYWYRVMAFSADGNSPYSVPVSATTLNSIPDAPFNLDASATENSIFLGWNIHYYNHEGFYIEQAPTETGPWTQIAQYETGGSLFYNVYDLPANTTYWFRIRAYNTMGTSGYSNVASATSPSLPIKAPDNLVATALSDNQINLTWNDNASSENGFRLETGESSGGPWTLLANLDADVTSYSHTGLATGTTYWYRVRTYGTSDFSDWSNTASATTDGLFLDAPYNLTATVTTSSQITLNWDDISLSEDGFRIERRSSVGSFAEIATVGPNTTTFTDNGLAAGVTYYYLVRAFNAIRTSKYSNMAVATTTGSSGPAAPSNLTATAVSSSQANLSWQDNSFNENGFVIERSLSSSGPWNQIAAVGSGVTVYYNTNLSGGVTYWYRVNAFNGDGTSAWSNSASATTPAGGYGNLALVATATASSAIPGDVYDAAKINDDNTATRWAASSGNFPEWVTLDLGSQHSVSEVELMFAFQGTSGDCYDFSIETSSDNVNWTTHVNQNPNWNTAQTQRYGVGANARYVRITVAGAPGSYRASLYEFRVFGQ